MGTRAQRTPASFSVRSTSEEASRDGQLVKELYTETGRSEDDEDEDDDVECIPMPKIETCPPALLGLMPIRKRSAPRGSAIWVWVGSRSSQEVGLEDVGSSSWGNDKDCLA